MTNKDDLAISRIREVRHSISAEHGHEPQKVVNYYIDLQNQYPQFNYIREKSEENVK